MSYGVMAGKGSRRAVVAISAVVLCLWPVIDSSHATESLPAPPPIPLEFSGTVIKQVNGKKHLAQVFAKNDRLRLEYKYAIRTERGYAAIEIIRLDKDENWYVLPQQKELLVMPLDPDDVLPLRATLPGERSRTLVGDAMTAGRTAQLYDVHTDRDGRAERFFEWVDSETGMVLKLVSQDRDWSFEYQRIRFSPQPAFYFDEPPGYKKRMQSPALLQQEG